MKKNQLKYFHFGSPVPDIEWTSPQQTIIKTTPSKYEISDSGRVLTILQSHPENEGFYICLGKAKTESRPQNVSLNVTCKIFFVTSFRQGLFVVYVCVLIKL